MTSIPVSVVSISVLMRCPFSKRGVSVGLCIGTLGSRFSSTRLIIPAACPMTKAASFSLSVSPDCKPAYNCVNYRVVSVRNRRAFCLILPLRSCYKQIYIFYPAAYLARMGFVKSEIFKRSMVCN